MLRTSSSTRRQSDIAEHVYFQPWERVLETCMPIRRSWADNLETVTRLSMDWDKCTKFVRWCCQIGFYRCAEACYRRPYIEHFLHDINYLMELPDPPRMLENIDYPRPFFKCVMFKWLEIMQYCYYFRQDQSSLFANLHEVFKPQARNTKWYNYGDSAQKIFAKGEEQSINF